MAWQLKGEEVSFSAFSQTYNSPFSSIFVKSLGYPLQNQTFFLLHIFWCINLYVVCKNSIFFGGTFCGTAAVEQKYTFEKWNLKQRLREVANQRFTKRGIL